MWAWHARVTLGRAHPWLHWLVWRSGAIERRPILDCGRFITAPDCLGLEAEHRPTDTVRQAQAQAQAQRQATAHT